MPHMLTLRSTALAMLLAVASAFVLEPISLTSARAQGCYDCKIPSGYTTVKHTGEICTNKRISCTCDAGGKTVKSTQLICLYIATPGGGGGGLNPAWETVPPKH